MLLLKNLQHLRVRFRAYQSPRCQPRKNAGVIPGSRCSQLIIPLKMKRIVQHRVPASQSADARIDRIQPQIVDHHVRRHIVADNDHQGGCVLHPENRPRLQRTQDSAAVNRVFLFKFHHIL